MGHKEDLLEGAKQVLIERGYGNTTARDIVTASHTNLASIGYHYGSLDALLTQAMIEMMGEWGEKFAEAAADPKSKDAESRFRAVWKALFRLFETDRALMQASFEIGVQASRSDELKAIFAATYAEVRNDIPGDFLGAEPLDPKGAPTADDLTLAIKTIARAFKD